jgi:hypothetical protein
MNVDLMVLGAALLTGLLGGAHCAAMCGGIATGLSAGSRGWWAACSQPRARAGYVLAGAIVGGIGGGLLGIARVPALGIAMRAAVGIVLVLAGVRLLDQRGRLPRFAGGPGARCGLAAPAATPPVAGRYRRQARAAGHAVGLDAVRAQHHPACGRVVAGQRRAWRTDHGRVRAGHAAGDGAVDLGRRAPGPAPATRRHCAAWRACW